MNDEIKQFIIQTIQQQMQANQYKPSFIPVHKHNGVDTPNIPPTSVTNFVSLPAQNVTSTTPPVTPSNTNGVLSSNNVPFNPPYSVIYPTPLITGFGAGGGSPDYSVFYGGNAPVGSLVCFYNESTYFAQLWIATATPTTLDVNATGTISSGATSATLSTNFLRTRGTYTTLFSNGNIRNVTFTNGATTATWTGGLTSNATAVMQVTIPTQWYGVTLDQSITT